MRTFSLSETITKLPATPPASPTTHTPAKQDEFHRFCKSAALSCHQRSAFAAGAPQDCPSKGSRSAHTFSRSSSLKPRMSLDSMAIDIGHTHGKWTCSWLTALKAARTAQKKQPLSQNGWGHHDIFARYVVPPRSICDPPPDLKSRQLGQLNIQRAWRGRLCLSL